MTVQTKTQTEGGANLLSGSANKDTDGGRGKSFKWQCKQRHRRREGQIFKWQCEQRHRRREGQIFKWQCEQRRRHREGQFFGWGGEVGHYKKRDWETDSKQRAEAEKGSEHCAERDQGCWEKKKGDGVGGLKTRTKKERGETTGETRAEWGNDAVQKIKQETERREGKWWWCLQNIMKQNRHLCRILNCLICLDYECRPVYKFNYFSCFIQ